MIYALPAQPGDRFVIDTTNRVKPKSRPQPRSRPVDKPRKSGFGGSVALTWLRRKIFLKLAFSAFELLGVSRRFLLLGNIRPGFRVFAVHFEPLFEPRLGVGLDRVGRALRLAHAAIDAFVRMDDQHVLALVEAIHGAYLDAVGIFALDAGFGDDVSHPGLRNGSVLRRLPTP